ncbi:MAG: hypothetical protein J07AB43_02940 [Candidatus Nanosalina sp. J07AB43]|jgi:hypothetical protein|nr:MAG: hypothetical protein J07AB43_02940 [Candidatus Nanosalina sp. J07AB43]
MEKAAKGGNTIIKEVNLSVNTDPTADERRSVVEMGTLNKAQYLQQYEVQTKLEEIPQGLINAIHNTVVEIVGDLEYDITGTKTTVI